jgi:hypothetical protein
MNQPMESPNRRPAEGEIERLPGKQGEEDRRMNEHQCPYGGEFGMDFLELEECKDCEWTYECGDACFGGLDEEAEAD